LGWIFVPILDTGISIDRCNCSLIGGFHITAEVEFAIVVGSNVKGVITRHRWRYVRLQSTAKVVSSIRRRLKSVGEDICLSGIVWEPGIVNKGGNRNSTDSSPRLKLGTIFASNNRAILAKG